MCGGATPVGDAARRNCWDSAEYPYCRAELAPGRHLNKLSATLRRKMFGTLTLIKRNGSEGSTMTMDSRETTIGR